jgi:hypothetical protein
MSHSLSGSYEDAFIAMLADVGERPPKRKMKDIGLCWPEIGKNYPDIGGLLVIGRAVNGFGNPFQFAELMSSEHRKSRVKQARRNGEAQSLAWVGTEYEKTGGTIGSRSAFWRIVRGTTQLTGHTEAYSWWDSVAWSNIAKIAPHASGNPPNWLGQSQAKLAWKLVLAEVTELNPSVVLFVTGGWVDEERLKLTQNNVPAACLLGIPRIWTAESGLSLNGQNSRANSRSLTK